MLVALLLTYVFATPTVGELLIDMQARQTFVDTWSPAYVRILYRLPLRPNEDPDRRPTFTTLGAIVMGKKAPVVVAAAQRLKGVKRVRVRFSDGKTVAAAVEKPADATSVPLVRVLPDTPQALKGRVALNWAPRKALVTGLKAWAIEWPKFTAVPGGKLRPNLVLSEIGKKVESPLDRFHYVGLGSADGMPLISHKGELLCVVFRQVPGTKRSSLCAAGDVAFLKVKRKTTL